MGSPKDIKPCTIWLNRWKKEQSYYEAVYIGKITTQRWKRIPSLTEISVSFCCSKKNTTTIFIIIQSSHKQNYTSLRHILWWISTHRRHTRTSPIRCVRHAVLSATWRILLPVRVFAIDACAKGRMQHQDYWRQAKRQSSSIRPISNFPAAKVKFLAKYEL